MSLELKLFVNRIFIWRRFGTNFFLFRDKSIFNTLCLVQSQNLSWTWHRFGTKICQVCTNHFLLSKISALGMDLTLILSFFVPSLCQLCTKYFMYRTIPEHGVSLEQIWPVFVPSLYQTFFAKYNLYTLRGFGTNSSRCCSKSAPNANWLVQSWHFAQMRYKSLTNLLLSINDDRPGFGFVSFGNYGTNRGTSLGRTKFVLGSSQICPLSVTFFRGERNRSCVSEIAHCERKRSVTFLQCIYWKFCTLDHFRTNFTSITLNESDFISSKQMYVMRNTLVAIKCKKWNFSHLMQNFHNKCAISAAFASYMRKLCDFCYQGIRYMGISIFYRTNLMISLLIGNIGFTALASLIFPKVYYIKF